MFFYYPLVLILFFLFHNFTRDFCSTILLVILFTLYSTILLVILVIVMTHVIRSMMHQLFIYFWLRSPPLREWMRGNIYSPLNIGGSSIWYDHHHKIIIILTIWVIHQIDFWHPLYYSQFIERHIFQSHSKLDIFLVPIYLIYYRLIDCLHIMNIFLTKIDENKYCLGHFNNIHQS